MIEYISLDPKDFDTSKGKGYNELLLINKTIQKSTHLKESDSFFKVTGRYPIYNIKHFLKKAERAIEIDNLDFYGDMKDYKRDDYIVFRLIGKHGRVHAGEARLFGSRIDWYMKQIGCRYQELNDYKGDLVENLLYEVLSSSDNVIKRFDREPHFGGFEGSMNDSFWFTKEQNSFKGNIKRMIGNINRMFFPNIWL